MNFELDKTGIEIKETVEKTGSDGVRLATLAKTLNMDYLALRYRVIQMAAYGQIKIKRQQEGAMIAFIVCTAECEA